MPHISFAILANPAYRYYGYKESPHRPSISISLSFLPTLHILFAIAAKPIEFPTVEIIRICYGEIDLYRSRKYFATPFISVFFRW